MEKKVQIKGYLWFSCWVSRDFFCKFLGYVFYVFFFNVVKEDVDGW